MSLFVRIGRKKRTSSLLGTWCCGSTARLGIPLSLGVAHPPSQDEVDRTLLQSHLEAGVVAPITFLSTSKYRDP